MSAQKPNREQVAMDKKAQVYRDHVGRGKPYWVAIERRQPGLFFLPFLKSLVKNELINPSAITRTTFLNKLHLGWTEMNMASQQS